MNNNAASDDNFIDNCLIDKRKAWLNKIKMSIDKWKQIAACDIHPTQNQLNRYQMRLK